jgi:hypothetical protein
MTDVTYITDERLRRRFLAALDTALANARAGGSASVRNGEWAVDMERAAGLGRLTVTHLPDGKAGGIASLGDGRLEFSSDYGFDGEDPPAYIPSIERFARLVDGTDLSDAALDALQGF